MHLASSLKSLAAIGLLTASLSLAGCSGGSSSSTQDTPDSQPTQATTSGGITTTNTKQAPTAVAQGTPTGPTNADISPSEVTVGNFVLTMSVEPIQHMFDSSSTQEANNGDDKNKDNNKDNQANGIAVLGGLMLKVTNNIDAAQAPKEDSNQGEVVRHLALQVKDKSSGQLVPYLTVSMDALRDGRPAFLDQALVPELPAQQDISQLRYGNNVGFPKAGTYQLFIRLEGNPLLGSDAPPAAQFNLTFK